MDLKGMPQTIRDKLLEGLRHPLLRTGAPMLLRGGIGFVLSLATVFGEYAPFGLGYAAAVGVGKRGIAGVIGAALGYCCILYRANGLKYLAILALICTACVVFSDRKWQERAWLMPTAAATSTACLGIVFVIGAPDMREWVFYLTEVLCVFGSTFLYRIFFHADGRKLWEALTRTRRTLVVFCLAATLALALVRIRLFDLISVGRVAAMCFVMLCGYYGGMGIGVTNALLQGLGAGAAEPTALYCGVYGISVLCGILLRKWGRAGYLSGFFAVTIGSMLLSQSRLTIALGIETVCAAGIFFALRRVPAPLSELLCEQQSGSIPIHRVTQHSLRLAAKAFSDLGDMLHRTFSGERSEQNIVSVFERPVRQICKKCTLCNSCWEKEYEETRDALNVASMPMQQNGVLRVTDFPFHFSTRCIQIGELTEQINRELRAYQTRKQYQSKLRQRQEVLCKQYREVSGVLENLAACPPPAPDVSMQKRLQRMLREAGILSEVCAWRDEHHRLHILMESDAEGESVLEAFCARSGLQFGRIERSRSHNGYRFSVRERETLRAELGVASRKKSGNIVCGDTIGHCKQPNGTLCILLADGMGTGEDAARESGLAVDLLIRFLESGIAPQSALATVHSALQLKGEESGAFTTLDLLCVDLFSGECVLYKFGSAPSYFCVTEEIKCITCTSMPIGLTCAGAPALEQVKCRLHAGNDVILISDGISDQAVPAWLMQTLKEKRMQTPQVFAKEILSAAEEHAQDSDDRTVLVFRLMQE